jgi:release factor glutamine methyltransferase
MKTATTRGIQELLQTATRSLTEAGIPDGRRETEALIGHILRRTRLDLYRTDSFSLDPDQQDGFEELIRRRASREPLQYILGTQEFWGLEFRVTKDTLIPRPETEHLIEAVREAVPETIERQSDARPWIDLCTGTGCLAITLAKLYPAARMIATDLSPAALEVARINALNHAVDGRIQFLAGDLFEPLRARGLDRKIDLLVSNPPYVPTKEMASLQPEVRDHEPRLALEGGPEGLDYYRRILPRAIYFARPGGRLCLEVGIRQADPVCRMARRTGWKVDRVITDLGGIDRVVMLLKP